MLLKPRYKSRQFRRRKLRYCLFYFLNTHKNIVPDDKHTSSHHRQPRRWRRVQRIVRPSGYEGSGNKAIHRTRHPPRHRYRHETGIWGREGALRVIALRGQQFWRRSVCYNDLFKHQTIIRSPEATVGWHFQIRQNMARVHRRQDLKIKVVSAANPQWRFC